MMLVQTAEGRHAVMAIVRSMGLDIHAGDDTPEDDHCLMIQSCRLD
jgi:hypothetical protein